MKRFLDFTLSLLALFIFLIPMLIIAFGIKLTSKGPVFFKQQRVGKNDTFFTIYKFRTMYVDTPNVSTESLGDPSRYITKLGKILRKTSLDELPQLFNIIKGDMSVVGPRPALYNQLELIEMRDKFNVNSIRPGLTGYAQIMGRDMISDDEKVIYDKYYLENMSIFLDMKIIFLTFFNVISAKGIKLS